MQAEYAVMSLFPAGHIMASLRPRFSNDMLSSHALVHKADGNCRIAAIEIMLANPAVRNLIREGKIHQLPNAIRMHNQQGMELLDQALIRLYRSGSITSESVFSFCNDRDEMAKLINNTEPKPSSDRYSDLTAQTRLAD